MRQIPECAKYPSAPAPSERDAFIYYHIRWHHQNDEKPYIEKVGLN